MRCFGIFLIYFFSCVPLIFGMAHESGANVAEYVVVGMGAGGANIARKLADAGRSVIAIEAGDNHDQDEPIKNSQFAGVLESNYYPQYFYQLAQILQSNAPNTEFNYTTGRLTGGGTSINGEQFVEGTDEFYAQFEAIFGSAWSPARVRDAFRKLEKFNGAAHSDVRGYHGLLDVRQTPLQATTMAQKFSTAVTNATGFPEIFDYNDPLTELGPFTRWQLTQKPNGDRESSSTAFLTPFYQQSVEASSANLVILTRTTALKILIEHGRAVGVSVLRDGMQFNVTATKKVIIAAGVNTPALLQVSGLGPKDVLEKAGVKVIADLPQVGQNLVNQLITVAVFTANPSDVAIPSTDPNALYVGGAFLPDPSIPYAGSSRGLRGVQLIGISPSPGTFIVAIIPLQPLSRGSVKIQSPDPLQIPLVDDGALVRPEDLATFKEIFKVQIKSIAQQLNLIDNNYTLVSPPISVIDNDADLEAYILENLEHTHHWTGTCSMGTSKLDGVVDLFGNVFEVAGLVVADATAARFIPDGNTQAIAYVLGSIFGDHILETH